MTHVQPCVHLFVYVARAWIFFLVKLLGTTTNCNINGISNYYPDFSISSFNSYCPIHDNIPHVTENFYHLAETLTVMLMHTKAYFKFKSIKVMHISAFLSHCSSLFSKVYIK